MATSVVSIWNLALQKVGQSRVNTINEDNNNARHCAACYDKLRRSELRKVAWNFSITRAILAPSTTIPEFTYSLGFPLPVDCLRVLLPPRLGLDWKIESLGGQTCILSNDGNTLYIRYIQDVTDPTRFDANFEDMLACKMAWNMCEVLTQSNTKKNDLQLEYKDARNEARRLNAFEKIPDAEPEAPWVAARRVGSTGADRSWAVGSGGSEY
jgi:hypothetical protein